MEILFLFALILLNGLFALSEIALVTARKARLQKLADAGDRAAAAAIRLGEDPTRFLSTIQIGITSIGILNGIVGELTLAHPLADWLVRLGVAEEYSLIGATLLVVILITYFTIVVGELVPKRIGQTYPEILARWVAKPINGLAITTQPFVWLLSASTHGLLRLLHLDSHATDSGVTAEEIHAILAEGTSTGVIESQEHTMVRNVFRLDDRQIASLMVPRGDVVVLDLDHSFDENMARVKQSGYARFPVVQGDMTQLVGLIDVRTWLANALQGAQRELAEQPLQQPLYVPETMSGMELLDHFRRSDEHMAFVIDEYGEIQGIVTVQDLIEAITGEFSSANPEDSWAIEREDGSWLLDGHIPIPELKDCLDLKTVPEEARGRYHTLSGMMMLLSGQIPKESDSVHWEGWRFEIVDMDGRTIDKVWASRLEQPLPPSTSPDIETDYAT